MCGLENRAPDGLGLGSPIPLLALSFAASLFHVHDDDDNCANEGCFSVFYKVVDWFYSISKK